MSTYNVNDANFRSSAIFKDFMSKYPKLGYLRVRAYSANEAIPIVGLNIIISVMYNNDRIIFYEGKTNESGITENIKLPAPAINPDNLDVPYYLTYDIDAIYLNNSRNSYKVNIYAGIQSIQNINAKPRMGSTGEVEWL